MIKILPNSTLITFILFLLSCNGPKEVEQLRVIEVDTAAVAKAKKDFDPYFTESTSMSSQRGPSSITRAILQDSKGNIWLATWQGIFHFDGKTFTNLTNKEGLRRHRIFTILEDRSGIIWFGSIGAGLYKYDGKSFTNYTTKDGLVNNRVGCLMEDKSGILWIGTEGGISKFDGKNFVNYTQDKDLDNDTNAIVEDKNGLIWIGARGYAANYDGEKFTKIETQDGKPFVNVRTIIEAKDGKIWLGGNDGLWTYNGTTYSNLSEHFTGHIYEDKAENIWVNAQGSSPEYWTLSRHKKIHLPFEDPEVTEIITEQNMFFGLTEDNEGNIWIGTLEGVIRYDGNSFDHFRD